MSTTQPSFTWRSQSAFIIVAAGATLSLNDFLTFPVLTEQHGGGAFLLLYILFLLVLGLPLLMSEIMLGRLTRNDPAAAIRIVSEQYKASVYWRLAGLASMFAAFLIIATLSVIGGWSLAYAVKSALGVFEGVSFEDSKLMFEGTIMPAFYVDSGFTRLRKEFVGKSIRTAQQVEDVVAYLMTLKED